MPARRIQPISGILAELVESWDCTDPSNIGRGFHRGINATVTGATYDATNQAAKFVAASSQYMSIADRAEIALLNQDFTWEFWFNRTASSNSFGAPVSKWPYEYALLYGNGVTLTVSLSQAESVSNDTTITAPTNSTWNQMLVWHDAIANTRLIQINTTSAMGSISSASYVKGVWRKSNALVFGALQTSAQYWDGMLKCIRLWKRVLSAREREALWNRGVPVPYQALRTLSSGAPNPRGGKDAPPVPSASNVAKVVYDGDSLTFGTGSTAGNDYPSQCTALLGSSYTTALNAGVAGQQSTAAYGDVGSQIDAQYSATVRSIVVLWIGTNDIASGTAAATTQSNITNYVQWRQNVGFKMIVGTILPRTEFSSTPAMETARQAMNTWIRANSFGADGIADIAADARIGDIGDQNDTTYYDADKVHLNNTGYAIVAGIVRNAIVAL